MTNIHAQQLGKLGGKKSAEKRLKGKTQEEISDMMRKIRRSTKLTKDKK